MKRIIVVLLMLLLSVMPTWALGQSSNSLLPAGSVTMFGGASAPSGWLICDGSIVNIASFPRLSAALGTAYNRGGEVATLTFRIPDFQGIFPQGVGTSGVYGANYAGTRGGYGQDYTYATLSDPGHTHSLGGSGYGHWVQNMGTVWQGNPGYVGGGWATVDLHENAGMTDGYNQWIALQTATNLSLGGRMANVTKPASCGIHFIIKAS